MTPKTPKSELHQPAPFVSSSNFQASSEEDAEALLGFLPQAPFQSMYYIVCSSTTIHTFQGCRCRGAKGAAVPPDFGRSINPSQTRWQIMPTTLLLALPNFQTFLWPCFYGCVPALTTIAPMNTYNPCNLGFKVL